MWSSLLPVIGGIVLEGMKFMNQRQKTKLQREHQKILQEIADAQNASFPDYTDAELDLANERLRIFLEAFWSELRKANLALLRDGERRS